MMFLPTMFLKAEDCSGKVNDALFIVDIIEQVGLDSVVQVIAIENLGGQRLIQILFLIISCELTSFIMSSLLSLLSISSS